MNFHLVKTETFLLTKTQCSQLSLMNTVRKSAFDVHTVVIEIKKKCAGLNQQLVQTWSRCKYHPKIP